MHQASITAEQIACERGGRQVFSNLSFTARSGDHVELRGPNGAGKSSLLRLLAGLNSVSDGMLSIDGAVHLAGHADAIKPAMTVRENLAFWATCLGGSDIDKALDAFALTRLANDPGALLSQGQRKRLALARLLAAKRPIWLLDEPTTGLDQANLKTFDTIVADHIANGGLVIVATHTEPTLQPTQRIDLGAP